MRSFNWTKHFNQRLSALNDQQLLRQAKKRSSPQGPRIEVNGEWLDNYASNDYLALANHPKVIEASIAAIKRYGVGSGSSHHLSGYSDAHERLQAELCALTGYDDVLLLSSGYMANLALLSSLADRHSVVYSDKLNHASIIDAGILSRARVKRYRHRDTEQLKHWLKATEHFEADRKHIIISDGVFSMDGDCAPLPELVRLKQDAGSILCIDDAHGFGVLGANGSGSISHHGLSSTTVDAYMGTFGKALGTAGAFIAADQPLAAYLEQTARSHMFTTTLPSAQVLTTLAALHVMRDEQLPMRLQANIAYFEDAASDIGLAIESDHTAIQIVPVGAAEDALSLSQSLWQAGIFAPAIRPPTVAHGQSRIRIALSAGHSVSQLNHLVDALNVIIK